MQNECLDIQERLGFSKEKYKRAALLMTEFLEDFLNKKQNILKDPSSLLEESQAYEAEEFDYARL